MDANMQRILGPEHDVQCASTAGRDVAQNIITLSAQFHKMRDDGSFALQPLGPSITLEDKSQTQEVQFWYTKQTSFVSDQVKNMNTYGIRPDTRPEHNDPSQWMSAQGDVQIRITDDQTTYLCLFSGHNITLKTTDHERYPLPSYELLEIQWHLARIVGMSAGAGSMIPAYYDQHDDDDGTVTTKPNPQFNPLSPHEPLVYDYESDDTYDDTYDLYGTDDTYD